MVLDDITISRTIIESYFAKLTKSLSLDVALVGAGPANLLCGTLLGEAGLNCALFESKLAPGGGMWGGGMMFNDIVVQQEARHLLDRLELPCREHAPGYFVADSVAAVATLVAACVRSGTRIFNLIKAVDVMFREENGAARVAGLVLQWSPVERLGLHVDPLAIAARFLVDGSGHDAEICSLVARKLDARLDTETGGVVGERSMWAERGESMTLLNSGEVYPGLYVAGMAANAVKGAPRMGPVFGGMLLSGEKVAAELIERCRG